MGRKLPWSRQTRPYGIKKSKWSLMTGRRERSAALACTMLTPSTVSQSLARERSWEEPPGGRREKGLWNSYTANKEEINVETNQ